MCDYKSKLQHSTKDLEARLMLWVWPIKQTMEDQKEVETSQN